jgi:hypothetical protein
MSFLRGYKESTLKAQLKMAVTRFSMAANKKSALSKQQTLEIAKMLEESPPKEEKARIKAEALIRDDNTIEAYEILELNCELLSDRIRRVSHGKGCPPDLVESVSTLIWASAIVGIPELVEIRKQFLYKYGKEFEEAALRNAGGVVNERVALKLSVQPPSSHLVQVYLETIADKHGVTWTPKVTPKASEMYEPTRAPMVESLPAREEHSEHRFPADIKEEDIFVPPKAPEMYEPTRAPMVESLPARGVTGSINASAPLMPSSRTVAPLTMEGHSERRFAENIKEEDSFVPPKASEIYEPTRAPMVESLSAKGVTESINASAPPMPSSRTVAPLTMEGHSEHRFAEDIKEENLLVPAKSTLPPGDQGGHDENGDDDGDSDGDLTSLGRQIKATKIHNASSMNSFPFKRPPFANDMLTPTSAGTSELRAGMVDRASQKAEDDENLCIVCKQSKKQVILLPCKHMCLCELRRWQSLQDIERVPHVSS